MKVKLTKKFLAELISDGIDLSEVHDINDVVHFCDGLIEYVNESDNNCWAAYDHPSDLHGSYPGRVLLGHLGAPDLKVIVSPGIVIFKAGESCNLMGLGFVAIGAVIYTLRYKGCEVDLSSLHDEFELKPLNTITPDKSPVDNNVKYEDPDEFDFV